MGRKILVMRTVFFMLMLLGIVTLAEAQTFPAGTVVCVDPGHPSETNAGRAVQHGLREVDINWAVAQKLAAVLRERHKLTVILTRQQRDTLTTNKRRAEIANAAKATLFLRLHCDTGAGSGFTSYFPDRAGTVEGVKGPSPAIRQASAVAAKEVHAGMAAALGTTLRNNGVKGESQTAVGKRQGALTGSIYSQVPAVTVEMVFLSNKADARFIGNEQGQQAMADALAAGVVRYLSAMTTRSR